MDRRQFLTLAAGAPLLAAARPALAETPVIRLRDLYNRDLSFSDYAQLHADAWVEVDGFMAPPLKAESNFFVLTKMPMAVCPFCDDAADWPADIVAVYGNDIVPVAPFNVPIRVAGKLELGTHKDTELGFVSRVRLTGASYRRV